MQATGRGGVGGGWREEEALGTVELGARPPVAQVQATAGQRDGVRPHGHRTGCVAPRWDPGQVSEPLWAFRSACGGQLSSTISFGD